MTQSSLFEQEAEKIERMRPLRPRQLQAVTDVRRAVAEGHKRIIVQAATGWGKTLWSAHIISAALRKGTKPLFTCPAITLIDQTLKSFEAEGIHDIGIIQAHHHRTNKEASVQIATLQTLERREMPDVGFAIIDECHEQRDAFNAVLDSPDWANKIVIGLSATPWARGMGNRWTKLIVAGTIQDMIADGFARHYPIYGPEHDLDRDAIEVTKGEFEEGGASRAMSEAVIVGDVLKEWKERSSGDKTFAFCVNRDHARVQIDAFADAGIPFGYIDANTPQGIHDNERGSRKHIFKQMAAGEIAGIASVGCLIRGVDEIVYNILDLQPTKSEMRHVQKWGRMRTGDANATYIGLDHAGNNQSLGLFTDIFHDTLDTRKPGERADAFKEDYKPAKPRKCSQCRNLVPPGARSCPTCNIKMQLYPGVTMKDGRMVVIGSGPKMNKEHQRWFSELLYVARRAGHKDGWASFRFQEKFGVKPERLKVRGKTTVSDDVKDFVRVQRKQYLEARAEIESSQRSA